MSQERQRAAQRERARAPAGGLVQQAHEAEHRQGREEHEQAVGARLLRIPHEQRVDRDERGTDQGRAAPGQLDGDRPHDGHRGDPGERRGQPQRERAVAEQAHVDPGQQVPQRRRVLAVHDRFQGRAEPGVQHVHGRERLVVPEALLGQRSQAQRRREHDQRRQRPPRRQTALAGGRRGCLGSHGAHRGHARCALVVPKQA